MIELYTWTTPNGQKVSIMLEEVGLPYRVHPIDIEQGRSSSTRTFSPSRPTTRSRPSSIPTTGFISWSRARSCSISPRRPACSGRRTFPTKWRVVEWLMWQMGGAGPFLGQVHHFVKFNPGKSAYAEERYTKEAKRLWGVLDRRLGETEYVAGDYSIADIAIWPWISRFALANRQLRRLSQCEALVRGDRGTAGGASGHGTCRHGRRHSHAVIGVVACSGARGSYGRMPLRSPHVRAARG